ncbi:MAG: glycosyltransferase family 39 protein, partial [Candidatus Micrarchaeota archaeon]|nr:glycosyltransferase family 39 protein [Candidatus Micrarchaeota archaeon]
GHLTACQTNAVYHDIIGYPFLIAIAFAIFGISPATAYGLQMLTGILSIFFIFLAASAIFEKKSGVIAATASLALMPELFIWSRTQAIPNLALMAFTTLTFALFIVFARRTNIRTFALFMGSLILTVYMRIEAILLIPIFLLLFFTFGMEEKMSHIAKGRYRLTMEHLNNNTKLLIIFLFFFMLVVPDVYYLSTQFANPTYGQDLSNQQLFSFANFLSNYKPNLLFFLGQFNSLVDFPNVFPLEITALAVIGGLFLAFVSRRSDRVQVLLLLLLWFFVYMLFYDFFYAGAATFGVDSRFMLQMIPPLCLLAGFGISEISTLTENIKPRIIAPVAMSLVFIALIIAPFITLIPNITLTPQQMPLQGLIYQAASFLYQNYTSVPTNCLVYTFTPDVWYEFNRSAAQIGYLGSSEQSFLNFSNRYSCQVIDFGYWCNVPPYKGTSCQNYFKNYNLVPFSTYSNSSTGENLSFYRIVSASH